MRDAKGQGRYYEDLFAKDEGRSTGVNVAAKAYRAVSILLTALDSYAYIRALLQLSLKEVWRLLARYCGYIVTEAHPSARPLPGEALI